MIRIGFKERFQDHANRKNTRLVFNLDLSLPIHEEEDQSALLQTAINTVREIEDLVAGVMVNRAFGDAVGLFGVKKLIERFDVPFIADYNLCDTDRNVLWMASELYEAGFEAVSVPAFTGKEPIKAIQERLDDKGLVITLSLPHQKKSSFMEDKFQESAELANELKAEGVIVAGNHLEDLEKANELIEDSLVFCNGFEDGKSSPGEGLKKEMDFEVIGKPIYESKDPKETVIRLVEEQRGYWEYDV